MKRFALTLTAVTAALVLAGTTGATAPQRVTVTAIEAFPIGGAATGLFTATGDVFGAGVIGTETGTGFHGHFAHGAAIGRPSFTYSAQAEFTTAAPAGTFTVKYEGMGVATSFDPVTGTEYSLETGNWQVTGGTGAWSKLQGTGTFSEPAFFNQATGGGGTITLAGQLHQ